MALKVRKVDVWAVEFRDEPGGLAKVLGPIAEAGGNLECIIARRQADKFQAGIAFITPLKGTKVLGAAHAAGALPAEGLTTLRVEGPDKPGSCHKMVSAIAEAGISMRGVSSMTAGKNFVAYVGLDSAEDAEKAMKVLTKVNGKKPAAKKKKLAKA
jgi:hypothetical protein